MRQQDLHFVDTVTAESVTAIIQEKFTIMKKYSEEQAIGEARRKLGPHCVECGSSQCSFTVVRKNFDGHTGEVKIALVIKKHPNSSCPDEEQLIDYRQVATLNL